MATVQPIRQTEPTSDRPLQALAELMLRVGWRCEHMRDPLSDLIWIHMMAQGDLDEHDMPEGGRLFWKSAKTKFRYWMREQSLREQDYI